MGGRGAFLGEMSLRPEAVRLLRSQPRRRSSGDAGNKSLELRRNVDFGGLHISRFPTGLGGDNLHSSEAGNRKPPPRELRNEDDLLRALDDGSLPFLPPAWSRPLSPGPRSEVAANASSRSPSPPQRDVYTAPLSSTAWPQQTPMPHGYSRGDVSRADPMLRIVSLMEWLSERGIHSPGATGGGDRSPCLVRSDVDSNVDSMFVRGRSAWRGDGRSSRRSLPEMFEQFSHMAEIGSIDLADMGHDLQIWQLKLLPRGARRRLMNLFAGRFRSRLQIPPVARRSSKAEDEEAARNKRNKAYDPDSALFGGRGDRGRDDDDQKGDFNSSTRNSGFRSGKLRGAGGGADRESNEEDEDGPGEGNGDEDEAAKNARLKGIFGPVEDDEDTEDRERGGEADEDEEERKRKRAEEAKRKAEQDSRDASDLHDEQRRSSEADEAARERARQEMERKQREDAAKDAYDPNRPLFRVKTAPPGDGRLVKLLLPYSGDAGADEGAGAESAAERAEKAKQAALKKLKHGLLTRSLAEEFMKAIQEAWAPYNDVMGKEIDSEQAFEATRKWWVEFKAKVRAREAAASANGGHIITEHSDTGIVGATRDSPGGRRTSAGRSAVPFATAIEVDDGMSTAADLGRPDAQGVDSDSFGDAPSVVSPLAESLRSEDTFGELDSDFLQQTLRKRRGARYLEKLQMRGDKAARTQSYRRMWAQRVETCQHSLDHLAALRSFAKFGASPAPSGSPEESGITFAATA